MTSSIRVMEISLAEGRTVSFGIERRKLATGQYFCVGAGSQDQCETAAKTKAGMHD